MPESLLSLKALHALNVVSQTRNFSTAAEALNVTPAAIQQLVRGLEANIDKKLVVRDGRGLKLTEHAKSVLIDIQEGFQLIERASTELKSHSEAQPLKITVEPTLATLWLVKRLDEYRRLHPKVLLFIDSSNRIVNLESGEADIALRFNARTNSALVVKRLFSDKVIAVCSPALIEKNRPLETPNDLKHFPLIHFDWPAKKRSAPEWTAWFSALGYDSTVGSASLHFNDYVLSIQATIAGQGVCLASAPLIKDIVDTGMLISPFTVSLDLGHGYDLIAREGYLDNPIQKDFINWIMSKAY